MTHPFARLAALGLVLSAAACVDPGPPAQDPQAQLLQSFHDPFGRSPVSLSRSARTHIRIAYVDSLFLARSPTEQRQHAYAIARYLWQAMAGTPDEVDTVSVEFSTTNTARSVRGQKTTHTFLFYLDQLRDPRQAPNRADAP